MKFACRKLIIVRLGFRNERHREKESGNVLLTGNNKTYVYNSLLISLAHSVRVSLLVLLLKQMLSLARKKRSIVFSLQLVL